MRTKLTLLVIAAFVPVMASSQVNSGSNGSDGAFNPTTNTVINMADHPDGIYHYTSINISNGVTVSFIPNANNTPVVWLVQSNCVINGTVVVSGESANQAQGGPGDPGGFRGGTGANAPTRGQGPGGGDIAQFGANASYGSRGGNNCCFVEAGPIYGNLFVIPLFGGSGGGGSSIYGGGGGGGGGAILIAASGVIEVTDRILARGGDGLLSPSVGFIGGGGSGGAIRLVGSRLIGSGTIGTEGGRGQLNAGLGRVRFTAIPQDGLRRAKAFHSRRFSSVAPET